MPSNSGALSLPKILLVLAKQDCLTAQEETYTVISSIGTKEKTGGENGKSA
jgi:hypothetical protein